MCQIVFYRRVLQKPIDLLILITFYGFLEKEKGAIQLQAEANEDKENILPINRVPLWGEDEEDEVVFFFLIGVY